MLTPDELNNLLLILKNRFEINMKRHPDLNWYQVQNKLLANPQSLYSLNLMEKTGGEPDVVRYDSLTDSIYFIDCSPESPEHRRSLCYDGIALQVRKTNKPLGSAVDLAESMGISLLTEVQYRELQTIGSFDLKTSSWIKTPEAIRKLGGALFCDRRYNNVFVYHNGADAYFGARGFRGLLIV